MNETKATRLATGVGEAMEQLIDILKRENQALIERDTAAVAGMVREKAAAARAYELKMKALCEALNDLGNLDGRYTETLERLGAVLEPLVEENARLLKVAMEANRRLLAAVGEAIRSLNPIASAYNPKGARNGDKAAKPMAPVVPISVDHSL
ncbi:MAG: flagellar export chaperone FlgN [Rhodospirillales bacterium]|nr:flagellar export chaperone FlgN [Rhodospirillales bacterium]